MVFSKNSIEFMADLDSQGLMLTYPSFYGDDLRLPTFHPNQKKNTSQNCMI